MEDKTKKRYLTKQNQNYWIIAILSVILVIFVPMAGSVAGLGWVLPTTLAGWIVYLVLKVTAVALNMMIFHSFVKQAKVNVKDHPKFLEAEALLQHYCETALPRSPKQFFSKQYKRKGTTLIITTLLSTICITQAVLTFDYISFIVHALAVVFAIIFGMQTMREDEDFWTGEYWNFAHWYVAEEEKKKQANTPVPTTTTSAPATPAVNELIAQLLQQTQTQATVPAQTKTEVQPNESMASNQNQTAPATIEGNNPGIPNRGSNILVPNYMPLGSLYNK